MSESPPCYTSEKSRLTPPFAASASLIAPEKIVLPAVVRQGHALLEPAGNLAEFLQHELQTPKLDALHAHLWLAGLPTPARPLQRQQLMNRKILLTERPDEHLVWHDGQVFLKPLPDYLLCHSFWQRHICPARDPRTYPSAVGLLLSYAWLVQYRSDFALARAAALLPEGFDYAAWAAFVGALVAHVDTAARLAPTQVDRRYRYGELRLSRLNTLTRLRALGAGRDFVRRNHINFSLRYTAFFESQFGWLLAAFAFVSVILSALQVGLGTGDLGGSVAFQRLSSGITWAALIVALSSLVCIGLVYFVLLLYHVITTRHFVGHMEKSREEVGSET